MVSIRNFRSELILIIITLLMLATACGTADAAFDCKSCHTMPPRDSSIRDWRTGGFKGNHQTHLPAASSPYDCSACHPVTGYTNGHLNRRIEFQTNINSSPAPAAYKINGQSISFKNQTTVPNLGKCSNVNCHFETETPLWGAAFFTYSSPTKNDCNRCHGAPPAGTGPTPMGGAAGSHKKHDAYFPGVANCVKCHADHLSDSAKFSHATSAGNRGLAIAIKDPKNVASGNYSGPANDYLPSQSNAFGTCSNLYCHSNGNGGAPLVMPQWGGGLDCRGCHGGDADHANAISTNKHRAHLDPSFNTELGTGTGFKCASCHVKTINTFVNNTTITNQALHVNTLKDYSGARAGRIVAAGQCANVYCHSSGAKVPTFRNMTGSKLWTGAANLSCKSCHGYGPGAFTSTLGEPNYANGGIGQTTANNHDKHVTGAGFTSTAQCAACHDHTVDSALAYKLKNYTTQHIDGNRDVIFSAKVGGSYLQANQTCSSTKCHGTSTPPQWGGPPLACNACHGANFTSFSSASKKGAHGFHYQGNSFSTYAQTPANSSNSTQYIFTCSSCHATPAAHSNLTNSVSSFGVAQVFFGFTAAGKKPAYNYGTSTAGTDSGTFTWTAGGSTSCNNTYCHSNGAGGTGMAIQWNSAKGTLGCSGCHGNASNNTLSGKHAAHLNPTVNTSLGLGNGLGCVDCHAKTVANSSAIMDKSKHVNKFVEYSSSHGGGSARLSSTTHLCTNIYCHSSGNQGQLVYVTPPAWNSSSTLSCNGCHGTTTTIGAPDYANGGSGNATSNSHSAHVAGYADTTVCADCHEKTADMAVASKLKNYTAAFYHINGTADLSFRKATAGQNITWNKSTGLCSNIACHGNGSATWGSTAGCLACHENPIGNRAGIGSQFSGNSHHVQGVTVNGTHCYQCHWEANIDGTVNRTYHQRTANAPVDLVIYGAGVRPSTYTVGTTAVQYTANNSRTELAKINTHCISCHSTANDAATPFGDGKTPKAYAWDGTSINARYGDTATTLWGKYAGGNVTPKNKVTKAFSAHGNATANQGGWDLNETWPNRRAGTANILCFDCHNSHGSTVSGTTTSYASATVNGGILKDTSAGKGGYSMTYKPAAGGLAANRNAYNAGAGLCFDCHLNASPVTTPWGYSSTFGATQSILGYMDTPYFGLGSFGTQQRYPYKTTANMGGHLGASSTLLVSATRPINGLCTPCHDPHGISTTMGTNRQYAVPLLKGTWVTSPYKEDVATRDNRAYLYLASPGSEKAPKLASGTFAAYTSAIKSYKIDQNTFATGSITQTDAQFAGLCLSCHPKTSLTNGTTHTWKSKDRVHESVKGWKTANATIKHNYTCSKCHAPHNARLPRLMVSNCLDYKHRSRVANNLNPVTSGSYRGSDGYGSGAIPGSYAGGKGGPNGTAGNGKWTGWGSNPPSSNLFTCHENNDSTQKWNTKTPWTQ